MSDGSGQLVMTVDDEPGAGVGIFNGLQLVGPIPVPEPTSLSTSCLALLALLAIRRRIA
jgi:hypothetical protein